MNIKTNLLTSVLPAIGIAVAFSAPGAALATPTADGETIFRQRCQACHSADANRPSPLGPPLAGVVGRKAGTTAFRYSTALRQSGLTWDRKTLDRYLASPMSTVPGTRMTISLSNPQQRAAVIDYLGKQR
jgi:cytochrome c